MELAAKEVDRVAREMTLATVRRAVTRRHLRAWVVALRKAADTLDAMAAEALT